MSPLSELFASSDADDDGDDNDPSPSHVVIQGRGRSSVSDMLSTSLRSVVPPPTPPTPMYIPSTPLPIANEGVDAKRRRFVPRRDARTTLAYVAHERRGKRDTRLQV